MCSFNEHKFCHTTPLIVELHWLPIRFRIVYFKILFITFKFLHGLAPSYLSSLISFRRQTRCNLRNSNHNLLLIYPSCISKLATLGDRSFTYAPPRLCNALPFDVRYTKSVNVFKVKLKTHLFSSVLLLLKISRTVGVVARLRHFVPRTTLLNIYQSLILAYLKYGLAAWGQAAKTHLQKILVLQKRVLRFIKADVIDCSVSDHDIIFADLRLKASRPKVTYVKTRSFKN